MAANRMYKVLGVAFLGLAFIPPSSRAQDPHLAEHPTPVTWVASLQPMSHVVANKSTEARAMALDGSKEANPIKVSFTCNCPHKDGSIVVNAPDPRNIQSVVLRQMRFPGDVEGPILFDVTAANHTNSSTSMVAKIPPESFDKVANVILNQQCMVVVGIVGSSTRLAGPILMYKSSM